MQTSSGTPRNDRAWGIGCDAPKGVVIGHANGVRCVTQKLGIGAPIREQVHNEKAAEVGARPDDAALQRGSPPPFGVPGCWVEQDPHHSVREILLTPPSAEGVPVLQGGGVQIPLGQTIWRFSAVVIKTMVHREID
jgi:hypothetical protein